jgi:hypothetical protein
LNAEILSREFLFPEGLAAVETVVDDPRTTGENELVIKQYFDADQLTLGAFMALLNNDNKLVITINKREDLEALGTLHGVLGELLEKLTVLFGELEAIEVPEETETEEEEVAN